MFRGMTRLANQAGPDCFKNRFGLRMDVKLFVDVTDVETDGVFADKQRRRSTLVAVAIGQQPENLKLPTRKVMLHVPRRRRLLEHRHHLVGDIRRHRGAAAHELRQRLEEPGGRRVLQQIPAGAATDRLKDMFVVAVNCQHQDLR